MTVSGVTSLMLVLGALLGAVTGTGACAPAERRPAAPGAPPSAVVDGAGSGASDTGHDAGGTAAPSAAEAGAFKRLDPSTKLSLADARRYMLGLVNRDRATEGLPPVELEEGSAQAAAEEHAADEAKLGYLGHWGSNGSVPEQRYTEHGGRDAVMENALGFTDEHRRVLDPAPEIEVGAIERAESQFFDEVPPNDGHRKNILKPYHHKVGIGVAQPKATATELAVPCFTQEFVDDYGTYAEIPKSLHPGATLHVEGSISAPATFAGLGLARVELPRPIPVSELNKRRSYPMPVPYQMYWPAGFKTPIPVKVADGRFAIDIPVSDGVTAGKPGKPGKKGLYELSIWARIPGAKDLIVVSLRTVRVE